MAQTEREIADCVGAVYEASTGGGDWHQVGDRLRRLMSAGRATLRILGSSGPSRNLLMTGDESDAAYAAYFHSVDPYTKRARHDFAEERSSHLGRAKIDTEIVAEDAFLRSEYYFDFARRHERRHMLTGLVGVELASPIALYRADGQSFGAPDVRLLETLLPHFQRALELRERLGRSAEDAWLTRAALDSITVGMAIVDAGLKLHFLNDAGRRQLDHGASGLGPMRSGPHAGSGVYLVARSRGDAATLRRLVASATTGGAGGAMRIEGRGGAACAVLVSPAPAGLATDRGERAGGGIAEDLAVIVLQRLGRAAAPSPDMLCDVYGFSHAEAEVATALSGGASAEDVARLRAVSLTTVRSQIRSILGKSECDNLRDLESAMASLSAVAPRRHGAGDR